MYKRSKFFNLKAKCLAGTYMNRINGDRDARWKMEGAPSVDGPNGEDSGGTAILIRPHIGMTAPRMPVGIETDQHNLYEVVLGHLSVMVVNGWTRSRLLAMSVYMDVRDKLRVKNRAILLIMGMLIVQNALPYIAMGDWNNPPEMLASSGWLHTVNGYVVAPSEPTCYATYAKEPTALDYAVMSSWLTPMVESISAVEEDPYQPHRQVILRMKIAPSSITEVNAICPTNFDEERPHSIQ